MKDRIINFVSDLLSVILGIIITFAKEILNLIMGT